MIRRAALLAACLGFAAICWGGGTDSDWTTNPSNPRPSRNETIPGDWNFTGRVAIRNGPIGYNLAVEAAGTPYTLTATPAALDFGTTDPVLVIDRPGTYLLFGSVNIAYNAATFAASRTVTLNYRRTNNTPGNGGASRVVNTDIVTTVTSTFLTVDLPPTIYTTPRATDSLTIFADVAVLPSAGSIQATQATLVAVRLF